ncbi:hypothetical protein [Citrobacter pasteurii]|nr:hypothetical protein [Citrobacter pasteurii]
MIPSIKTEHNRIAVYAKQQTYEEMLFTLDIPALSEKMSREAFMQIVFIRVDRKLKL